MGTGNRPEAESNAGRKNAGESNTGMARNIPGFSLKVKLTILYTFFMLLVICAVLAILLSLSTREVLSGTQARLRERVADSTDDILLQEGELQVKSDFYSISGDIYLSLYDENGYLLYGKIPYGFNATPEFRDGVVQTIEEAGRAWYVYDFSFRLQAGYVVYIRGITSITDAEAGFAVTVRFAVILLPSLVALMALIGYRLTRRTLLPVKKMTRTVLEICEDADLSRRVGLGKNGSGQDEIASLADTFDTMLEQLEQVFAREKQFTSDVSHELRTPVGVILAQCEAMLTDESLTEVQKAQIELVEKKAREMSQTISALLFLSRADQGRQALQREWLNVSELTQMVCEEEQLLADESGSGVRIICETEPELYAWVDETFYIRMLSNLVSNGVFYGKEKGYVKVTLKSEDGQILGRVEDDGIGIPKEALPRIWERFYRVDSARTGGHSGLGLPMVKWIAQAHGGDIGVSSQPGKGSCFSFAFPVQDKTEKNS